MRPLVAKVERIDGGGSDWVCGSPWTLSAPPFGLPSFLRVDFQAGSKEEARLRLSAMGFSMSDRPVRITGKARFYSTKEVVR
jgi:hypothetical protein